MKLLLSFCMLLIASIASPQNKMTGLGNLQLGTATVKIIDEIANENSVSVDTSYRELETKDIDKLIEKKCTKISERYNDPALIDPNVKSYYIDNYTISDITLNQVYLYFYADTLYKITCDLNTDIMDALSTKYGNPSFREYDKKIVTCRNGLGIEYKEEEKFVVEEWTTNNTKVECSASIMFYVDNNCKKRIIGHIGWLLKKKNSIVQAKIDLDKKKKDKEAADKVKAKLKDF
jgi:hypothetical protein